MKWLLCGFGPMVALAMAGPAAAADASVPLKGPIADADNAPAPRVAVFSGVDITSQGRYSAFLGGTIAASGDLDTSGFRVGIVGASGTYKFHSETFDTLNRAIFTTANVLAGYAIERERLSAALYIGATIENHHLSEADPINPLQGTAIGPKIQAELSLNPTDLTRIFAEASYTTAFKTYDARLRLGYDVSNGNEIFVGPEVIAMGNLRFNETRIGAHVTAFKLGKLNIGISGGYLHESEWGRGAYGVAEFNFKF